MAFGAAPAWADKPTKQPLPSSEFTVTGIGCGFDVKVTPLENKEVTHTFSDGRVEITGTFKVRLTNVETGKSIVVNISGPAALTPNGDGTFTAVLKGRSLIFPNAPPEATTLFFVNSGRTIMIVNESLTHWTLLNFMGMQFDVCKALG
jgi:hypothetical protein